MKKTLLFVCTLLACQLALADSQWPNHYQGGGEKLFYNQQTIEQIRERIDTQVWAKNLYQRLKQELADPEAEAYKPLKGLDGLPRRSYEGRWTRDAVLCYRIDGDETHLPKAIDNIVSYFKLDQPNQPCFLHDTTKAFEKYWEWGWYSLFHLTAYDMIKNHPLMRPYHSLMEQRIEEIIAEGKRYEHRIERLGNVQFFGVIVLGIYGFVGNDTQAVDLAVNGENGFKSYLMRFRDEGCFAPEPLHYTFGYVDCCMTLLAEAARKNNYPEDLYYYEAPNGASMYRMYESFLQAAAPNGFGFDNGDGGVRQGWAKGKVFNEHTPILSSFGKIHRTNQKHEVYHAAYRTPTTAWAVAQNPNRDDRCSTFWGYSALTHGIPCEEAVAPEARSVVYPEMGNAYIKSVQGRDYWWSGSLVVHIRNGASQQFHSHNDHFSFTLTAFDKFIYNDHMLHWDYLCPRKGRANYTPMSGLICNHNTVVVDGREPDVSVIKLGRTKPEVPGVPFSEIEQQGPMQCISCEGAPYGGVWQKRTFYVTPEYVLDIFALKSDSEHTYDYLLHSLGRGEYSGVGTWSDYPQLSAEYGLRDVDSKSKRDDRWWLMHTQMAPCLDAVQMDFLDTDSIGVHTTVLYEPNTQLITTSLPTYISCSKGWNGSYQHPRRPMAVVRRHTKATTFVALHEPYQNQLESPLTIERAGDIIIVKGAQFVDTYNLTTKTFTRQ